MKKVIKIRLLRGENMGERVEQITFVLIFTVQKLCEEFQLRIEPFELESGESVLSTDHVENDKRYFTVLAES